MTSEQPPRLLAHACENAHVTYPTHSRCPACGDKQTDTVDLTAETGTVVSWTTVESTPPGVREPNTLALVEFSHDRGQVTVLGGTTADVSLGTDVTPVYVERLRNPEQSVRDGTDQPWDGFRFEPV